MFLISHTKLKYNIYVLLSIILTNILLINYFFIQLSLLVYFVINLNCGPGSSVHIAIDYGLDDPGSNPGGDEIFRSSRPALGPTQLPVQWVPGLFQGESAAGACC